MTSRRCLTPQSRGQIAASRNLPLTSNVRPHQVQVRAVRRVPKPVPKRVQPTSWLVGTWQSDKEKTIRRWDRYHAPRPEGGRRSFVEEHQLGKSVNRFTKARWHHSFEGSGFSLPYRVVWQNSYSVFVVYSDRGTEYGELITFASRSTYYVVRGGYSEFFTKVREA